MNNRLCLDFYGVGVVIESDDESILCAVGHDFSFFLSPPVRTQFQIVHATRSPDYKSLPIMKAFLATPRNIGFKDPHNVYIDYFGRALNRYDKRQTLYHIHCRDKDLSHEIIYLTILARVSELLDDKGLHRIHGLGLSCQGRGILVLLPSGGGKSTLALRALMSDFGGVRLISEDSPLVGRDGALWPFPLRIGVLPYNVPPSIDPGCIRHIKRMEFHPKVTIDTLFFENKLCVAPARPHAILLGERSTGDISSIQAVSKHRMIKYCMMNSVIGVGLYQGLEFLMQKRLVEVLRYSKNIYSRAINNYRLVSRSKIYAYTIGANVDHNVKTLREFVESTTATSD